MKRTPNMSNVERRPECSLRTSLGNCDSAGGFCTSVSYEICEALRRAYFSGYYDGSRDTLGRMYEAKRRK